MAINLLPPKYRPKPLLEWKNLRKMLFLAITVFAIGFLGTDYYFFRIGLEEREANLQANIDNLKPIFNKIEEYDSTLEKMKKIEEITEKIGKAREVWSEILADLAGSLTEDIWFIRISKEEDKVIIEGESQNFAAVGNLAVNIRKLQWFKQVDVDEAERIKSEMPTGAGGSMVLTENVKFRITAQLLEGISLFVAPEKGGTKQ